MVCRFLEMEDKRRWKISKKLLKILERNSNDVVSDFTYPDQKFRTKEILKQKQWIDNDEYSEGYCRVLSGQKRPDYPY